MVMENGYHPFGGPASLYSLVNSLKEGRMPV